jgi:hypothetical protein
LLDWRTTSGDWSGEKRQPHFGGKPKDRRLSACLHGLANPSPRSAVKQGAVALTSFQALRSLEIAMSSNSDLDADLDQLVIDKTRLANENGRLRRINAQMLAALKYVFPILRDAVPTSVDFDWTKQGVAKVQDAIAEAERDA